MQEFNLLTKRGERRKIKKALRGYVRRSDRMIASGVIIGELMIAVGIFLWTIYTIGR